MIGFAKSGSGYGVYFCTKLSKVIPDYDKCIAVGQVVEGMNKQLSKDDVFKRKKSI